MDELVHITMTREQVQMAHFLVGRGILEMQNDYIEHGKHDVHCLVIARLVHEILRDGLQPKALAAPA